MLIFFQTVVLYNYINVVQGMPGDFGAQGNQGPPGVIGLIGYAGVPGDKGNKGEKVCAQYTFFCTETLSNEGNCRLDKYVLHSVWPNEVLRMYLKSNQAYHRIA